MFNLIKALFVRKPTIRKDLSGCPFCTSHNLSLRELTASIAYDYKWMFIRCNDCGAEGPSFTIQNSIQAEQDWCERPVRRLNRIYKRFSEVASCPFCDCADVSLEEGFCIMCSECHAVSPERKTREEAIKIWNA